MILFANILIFVFFIFDRALKRLAVLGYERENFFIQFSQYKNKFIALNIPVYGIFFYFLAIIIFYFIVFALIKAWQKKNLQNIFALELILCGGGSNILDRINYNAVIDYLGLFNLVVFNIADIMIVLGVIILVKNIFSNKVRRR